MKFENLSKALAFAAEKHANQFKKETQNPYIYHPLAVASLVLQYGGTEEQAMAGLLHDTIGDVSKGELSERFGVKVAELAYGFSDPPLPADVKWFAAKEAYVSKVKSLAEEHVLIIACEELHDGRELVHDLRRYGAHQTLKRYTVGLDQLYWYYRELLNVFVKKKISSALNAEFALMLTDLKQASGLQSIESDK